MSDPAAPLSDEALLDRCQATAFDYFLENVNDANGLVADTSRHGSPASIAVVGFALSCYPIGVERGWISRARAAELTLAALRFFRDSAHGMGLRALAGVIHAYPTQAGAIRMAADAYQRSRLTPLIQRMAARWLRLMR